MDSPVPLRARNVCVYTHLFPARSETFIREHVTGLAKAGHQVVVLARQPGSDVTVQELAAIDCLGVERVYLGRFAWFSSKLTHLLNLLHAGLFILRYPKLYVIFRAPAPWTIRELLIATEAARFIHGRGFDVAHVHFGHLAACLRMVGQAFDGFPPLVVTWHGYDVNVRPKLLGRRAYRALFESRAVHTVGSEFTKKRLVKLGAREESVVRVPMGVDIDSFAFVERHREAGAPFTILSVGRLEEVKGHSYLIRAVARLKAAKLPVCLKIAGDGPLKESLRALILELGLCDCVELLGAVNSDRVVREMHAAHLFALTGVETASGKVESQGVVFAEAQATGLPIVASRLGGVPESLVDGETGFLCTPGRVDEVVEAIRLFVTTPSLAAEFGRRGRDFVEETFSNGQMLARFGELYLSLVSKSEGVENNGIVVR